MPVSREQIVDAYHFLLGREPESEAVIQSHESHQDWSVLRAHFMASSEFRQKFPLKTDLERLYDGLRPGDEELLRRHLAPSAAEPGFVGNFLGTLMNVEYTESTRQVSGYVYGDIPTVVGDYHAEPIEFIGTLRAIEAGSGPFVAVELGAGWGSWTVTAGHVARRLGRTPIRLYAVEASAGKVLNVRDHFAKNGFDPEEHKIVTAAIGPADGFALFPLVHVVNDYGGQAIFLDGDGAVPEREGYETVPCVRLSTLIAKETIVDLIHFDVQGAEREVVADSIGVLNDKVRFIIIGTHLRSIEGALFDLLISNGWHLVNEQPARVGPSANGGEEILVDGTQVWRNPRIA